MKPKFSIITPSFRQGQFIERTIQSVLSQNMPSLEYVVVDGGSQDETVSILEKYSSQLRWVSEKDKGQTDAVNKGLAMTTGDIIGWLNSDDIYYPEALKKVEAFFDAHPDVDIIYGDANHIDTQDKIIEPYPTETWDIERLKVTCYLCQPAVFFRRQAVEKFGLLDMDLNYCMDYEYWMRLALGGARFAQVKQLLAGSRFYQETKTLGAAIAVHAEINSMLREKLGQTPDHWLSSYAHVVVREKPALQNSSWRLLALTGITTYAALRWNRRISGPLFRMQIQWIKAGFARFFQRRFAGNNA